LLARGTVDEIAVARREIAIPRFGDYNGKLIESLEL
jgi:hypothetical protein